MAKATNTEPHLFSSWRQDFLASLVVFLVALPLCMAIALASGAPIAAGLVTGIIGGLVVGAIAGAPLQVSGPAAGLTVVCGELIRQHGLPALGVCVMIAGVLQMAAGIMKLGQWFRAVSPAVIHGMLSGIGVLILSSQIHVLVDAKPRENGIANLRAIPESILQGLPLPTWEPLDMRQARTQLLQDLGHLHIRRAEISRAAQRIDHRHKEHEPGTLDPALFRELADRQELLAHDFTALLEKFDASALSSSAGSEPAGWRHEDLRAAMQASSDAQQAALADLRAGRLDRVRASQATASSAFITVLNQVKSHAWAAKVGLLAILVIVLWQAVARGTLKLVPAPLLAVLITVVVAWAFALPVLYVEVPDNLFTGLTFPSMSVLENTSVQDLIVGGLMMAAIASAETLLCATAVDKMHSGVRTQYDRELAAQGFGNFLCGLVGALPMTGVIVRSGANVQAGAKSRLSAILHGLWLVVFVLLLSPLLRLIPTSALAGILVYTGARLIDWRGFVRLWEESRTEALIFLVTVIVIVSEDLLTGVITGIILSALKLLLTFSRLEVDVETLPNVVGHPIVKFKLTGAATFLRLPILAAKLEKVPPGAELHVDVEHLDYIDHACLELLIN